MKYIAIGGPLHGLKVDTTELDNLPYMQATPNSDGPIKHPIIYAVEGCQLVFDPVKTRQAIAGEWKPEVKSSVGRINLFYQNPSKHP